jgi:hypothetical protein
MNSFVGSRSKFFPFQWGNPLIGFLGLNVFRFRARNSDKKAQKIFPGAEESPGKYFLLQRYRQIHHQIFSRLSSSYKSLSVGMNLAYNSMNPENKPK